MWTWMRHPEHGGVNRFPTSVVEAYLALGWEPCDPPADQGPHLHALRDLEPKPGAHPAPEPQPDQQSATTSARAKRGSNQE